MAERPLCERAHHREEEGAQDGDPKPMDLKALDETTEHPEEKSIHDKGKESKCQEIERKGEKEENWLDRNPNNTPEQGQNEGGPKAFDRNTGNNIRERQKGEGAHHQAEKYHRIWFTDLHLEYSTSLERRLEHYSSSYNFLVSVYVP